MRKLPDSDPDENERAAKAAEAAEETKAAKVGCPPRALEIGSVTPEHWRLALSWTSSGRGGTAREVEEEKTQRRPREELECRKIAGGVRITQRRGSRKIEELKVKQDERVVGV